MLDTKKHAYDLLVNNSALTTALGASSKIQFMYPNDFNAMPIITYAEIGNSNYDYFDNAPFSDESIIEIHIWANVSTTTLAKLVDTAMVADLYHREYSADVPEPNAKIFHRVARYRRTFTADDLD